MAQKKKQTAVVYRQTVIASDVYDMWIETDLAAEAKAGQFISVYPRDASTLLPRPISICETDKVNNRIRIVYRIAGKGTKEFSTYHAGQPITILGILGNGFPLEAALGKKILLMGGGIGIPPMLETAKELEADKTIIVGYRNHELFLKKDLEKYGVVVAATEDGSAGTKGTVLDAVREHGVCADMIFACGPMAMLRAIKQYAEVSGIKAYISLEEKMACGVGVCLGCVCNTVEKDAHSHVNNTRICTEGPVFDAAEVDI